MADNQSREFNVIDESVEKANENLLSVKTKVNIDVSEALTGLKAIQREAKKATQALRELEEAQKATSEPHGKISIALGDKLEVNGGKTYYEITHLVDTIKYFDFYHNARFLVMKYDVLNDINPYFIGNALYGIYLRKTDIEYRKGECIFDLGEPTNEPMRLVIGACSSQSEPSKFTLGKMYLVDGEGE